MESIPSIGLDARLSNALDQKRMSHGHGGHQRGEQVVELPRIGTGFEHHRICGKQMGGGPRLKRCQRHTPGRKEYLLVCIDGTHHHGLLMDIQSKKPGRSCHTPSFSKHRMSVR